ncbi:MAG TPA: hypothetical protein VH309_08945 [Elusimicrobiota bacterium]|jgi:hypothetical protein|nr:hypothetical protein [Elusimicrobiota bacterium]
MRGLAAAALLLLTGCASVRPAEPTSLSHGLLIARARVRGAVIPFFSDKADAAEIEQIDQYGNALPGKVARSGYSNAGGIYFLDLPRGRYALKSISFAARGARYEVVLSSAVLRPEAVELRPGEAAFLGELTVDGRFPDFDVAVDRALGVAQRWAFFFLRWPPIDRDADFRALDRGPAAERRALLAARSDLAQSQWRDVVAARLREVGAAEPAARAGGLRNRILPLKQETFFGWRDTLKWGEPARVPEGLAWRRPGGEARVAVFFTSGTVEGFEGYQEAVRQMRAAAGGLDDPDAVYEVRVGTRTGEAARVTTYHYPRATLVGSVATPLTTETTLVDDPAGMFTARLRAPRDEFEKVLPAYREFLLQLVLGPPAPPPVASEPVLP